MSRIPEAFDHGKAFIAFITCGDPDLETTGKVVRAAVKNGADLIELGIPFSDPTAEGPVIQSANLHALQNGVTTDRILDFVHTLRTDPEDPVKVPLVFMTYANVVFSYGYKGPAQGMPGCSNPGRDMQYTGTEAFLRKAAEAGVDGLILPDVPFEEKDDFAPACRKYGIDLISMVAPTSESRISMIAKEAEGFLYIVSSLGVTGERTAITTDLDAMVRLVRAATDVPCAIGFGISTPEQAADMMARSDGAIVGSAIIRLVEQYGRDAAGPVGALVGSLSGKKR